MRLAGILPALVTPLDERGELNVRSYELLLERVFAAGCDGVYVCGQTGEGMQLSRQVRERALEVAVEQAPRGKTVIAHVGALSTEDALKLVQHASGAGAHAVSSLPPGSMYSFEEAKQYYQRLASAATIPLLVYYFPGHSTAIRTLEEILELCRIPGVVGLKYTDFDLYRLSQVERAGYTIFNGHDEVLAAGLLMGAHGGVGSFYNLAPRLFVGLLAAARAGDWAGAQSIQVRINELISSVLPFPVVPAIKRILTWSGIDCGRAVPPRRSLTAEEEARLRVALEAVGFSPEAMCAESGESTRR
jgi:N-acetylneuraminate lyase